MKISNSKQSIRRFQQGAQAGFTLIELIVVIVILGILAATAIPRFINLSADARLAKINGARASVQAAAALAHARWLVDGAVATATSVSMEGTTIALTNGYPDATSILAAAGITEPDFKVTAASGTTPLSIAADATHLACAFTYTAAAAANAAPTIAPAPVLASCQ